MLRMTSRKAPTVWLLLAMAAMGPWPHRHPLWPGCGLEGGRDHVVGQLGGIGGSLCIIPGTGIDLRGGVAGLLQGSRLLLQALVQAVGTPFHGLGCRPDSRGTVLQMIDPAPS
jgi:hypothetical protein